MKKFLSICLILMMVMGITLTATAAPAGFVSSPSATAAPQLVSSTPKTEGCTARLVITPFSKKSTLPADVLAAMDAAYQEIIANGGDLTKLTSALADILKSKKLSIADIAISDLFDVTNYDCNDHQSHDGFDIVVSDDSLKHFVALLHRKNGKWEVVDNAKIVGDYLHFSVDTLSPFAVVVDHSKSVTSPQTGNDSHLIVYAAIMVISAGCLAIIWKKSRKIAQ